MFLVKGFSFLIVKVYIFTIMEVTHLPNPHPYPHTPTLPLQLYHHFVRFYIQCLHYYYLNAIYSLAMWYTDYFSFLNNPILILTPLWVASYLIFSFSFLCFNTNYFEKFPQII